MKNNTEMNRNYPIVVHCHLRWDGVWQRPQQFLSRLSKNHPVLFVEGPTVVDQDVTPTFSLKEAAGYPNVTIMQTEFPHSRFQDGEWVDAERRRLLLEALSGPLKGKFEQPVQWIYDPMATTAFAGRIGESALVYDCMDELSQFKFAPPEIIKREQDLLAKADVVFTGGRGMWNSKKRFNNNCHFYGCGVDVKHFATARAEQTAVAEDIKHLKKPVLGYFGVVDERLDYDLIAKLVAADPNWNVVIVGPFCKVNPDELPKHERLHWLGRREYAQLPAYTKGWDVCLMPFAMNEATQFINPTKALEYMATGRPIVSTPVPDVVSNFGEVVKIGQNHNEFIEFCRDAVITPDEEAVQRGIDMANNNQWETIVAKLDGHVFDALTAKASPKKNKADLTLATA